MGIAPGTIKGFPRDPVPGIGASVAGIAGGTIGIAPGTMMGAPGDPVPGIGAIDRGAAGEPMSCIAGLGPAIICLLGFLYLAKFRNQSADLIVKLGNRRRIHRG